VRRYGLGRTGDVAQVGLMVLVERRGDADDDRIHLRDLRVVGGGAETTPAGGLHIGRRDSENVGAAGAEGVDLLLVDVEAGDRELLLAEQERQRQADVAESDNADVRLARLNL